MRHPKGFTPKVNGTCLIYHSALPYTIRARSKAVRIVTWCIQTAQAAPTWIDEEHPDNPGVSSAVGIHATAERGRHAVAATDIAAGTLVAAGLPAVFLLNPDDP